MVTDSTAWDNEQTVYLWPLVAPVADGGGGSGDGGGGGGGGADPPPPKPPKLVHELHFAFVYPDGKPVKDAPYVLIDPAGQRTPGQLPGSGLIDKRDVPPGEYTVQLRVVQDVRWARPHQRCDQPLRLTAHVLGCEDGAAARVRIFREHHEEDGEELATLSGKVKAGAVAIDWRYQDKADKKREAQGVVHLIAEVSVDGGAVWGKTHAPAQVELPTVAEVSWQEDRLPGPGAATLRVRALGFADGTPLEVKVLRQAPRGGSQVEAQVDGVKLGGGQARVTLPVVAVDKKQAGKLRAGGEYVAVVRLRGQPPRSGRSDVLWCAAALPGERRP